MSAWRQQALIEAPLESVWELVGDPKTYPEWAADVVDVTGLPEVIEHATFEQVSKTPLGKETTTFEVEKLDELHEIRLRCTKSGYYSHWTLTPARDSTFAEFELGVEPTAPQYRLYFGLLGKRYLRKVADQTLAGIQRVIRQLRS